MTEDKDDDMRHKLIRIPLYAADKRDARKLWDDKGINSEIPVYLDVRNTTFIGTSFIEEFFFQLAVKGVREVRLVGSLNEQLLARVQKYAGMHKVKIVEQLSGHEYMVFKRS